jgi:hypothetical protein
VTDLARLYESAIRRWGDGEDHKPTDLELENQVHELQERIWCSGSDLDPQQLALGVIEYVGGTFETEDAEHAVEHLGKAMVCAAGYAYLHGLAIAPILDLARALTRRDDVQPVHGVTRLAALERQDLVESHHVVAALGLCIAKGIDDCEIVHGLTIEPHGVFLTIGREMLATMATPAPAPEPAIGIIADAVRPKFEAHHHNAPIHAEIHRVSASYPNRSPEEIEREVAKLRSLLVDIPTLAVFDPAEHVNPLGICPQCATPMSPLDGTGYRCENGHELTTAQMDALLRASTAPSDGS